MSGLSWWFHHNGVLHINLLWLLLCSWAVNATGSEAGNIANACFSLSVEYAKESGGPRLLYIIKKMINCLVGIESKANRSIGGWRVFKLPLWYSVFSTWAIVNHMHALYYLSTVCLSSEFGFFLPRLQKSSFVGGESSGPFVYTLLYNKIVSDSNIPLHFCCLNISMKLFLLA